MKKNIAAILFLTVSLFSCTKKSGNNPADPAITTGTWRISYYWDKTDQTANYNPYIFMFNTDGSFMGHTSSSMITGTWSETGTRLTINFASDPVLSKLNGNWLKTEKTATNIKLKDDNPSQDDQLFLVKN